MAAGWFSVAEAPQHFLSLGLCSSRWLKRALPTLLAAEQTVVLDGDSLVHCDLRSDNLCLRGDSAVLIDWNHACIGNAQLDLMSWLPSLHADGGPEPEEVVGHGHDATGFAAYFSGYWAASAGMPPIPNAPRVRPLQLRQLKVALPWAVRALQLPPLDGCHL
jgi:thiamine kinase-like enzyme